MADVKLSSANSINWRDITISGAIAAATIFFSTGGSVITEWINTPTFHFDWAALIVPFKNGIYAFVSTIAVRFFQGNKAVLTGLTNETIQSIKDGDAVPTIMSK